MSESVTDRIAALRNDYVRYDQYVDVVSCFEWMFTAVEVQTLPSTVKYLDRYPKCVIERAGEGSKEVTPDFAVVFEDDSVLVGEIAAISQRDTSVDKLCSQLLGYDQISLVNAGNGSMIRPSRLDVMWLVPTHMANKACKRVLVERYQQDAHSYSPSKPPCIVQYSRTHDRYAFARIPHPANGSLSSGLAVCQIGTYLEDDLNIKPERFVDIKTERAFMNDAAVPLYLATYLYVRIWPMMFGGGGSDERTSSQEVARELQRSYGYGRAKKVTTALQLLEEAGLARSQRDGTWTVKRKLLGVRGDRETHEKILELMESTPNRKTTSVRKRSESVFAGQGLLFDLN